MTIRRYPASSVTARIDNTKGFVLDVSALSPTGRAVTLTLEMDDRHTVRLVEGEIVLTTADRS